MNYKQAAIRALTTFISGAVTSPIASIALDVGWWKTLAMAGGTAVVNLAYRASQAWLTTHPGP